MVIVIGFMEVKVIDLIKEIIIEEVLEFVVEDMWLNKNEVCLLENIFFFYVCGE